MKNTGYCRTVCVSLFFAFLAIGISACEELPRSREDEQAWEEDLDGTLGPCIHQPEFVTDDDLGKKFGMAGTGGGIETVDRGTDKPEEVLANFAEAQRRGHLPDAVGCMDYSDQERLFVEKAMTYIVSLSDFMIAIKDAYGEDAKGLTLDPEIPWIGVMVAPEVVSKMSLKPEGDKISLPPPQGTRLELRKKGNKWYVSLLGIPSEGQREGVIKSIEEMKLKVDELKRKAGTTGVTAEALMGELAAALKDIASKAAAPANTPAPAGGTPAPAGGTTP